ncbi:MAG: hypothetical protein IKF36_03420 [Bacilli bacterium]|nr:hypothetical protein [Bacilli bacterium]
MKDNPFQGKIDIGPLIDELLDIQYDICSKTYLEKYPMDNEIIEELRKYSKDFRNKVLEEAINKKIRIKDTSKYNEK